MTQSTEPGKIWLTKDAFDKLNAELEDLKGPVRADVIERISNARDEGDLKENGGYHAARSRTCCAAPRSARPLPTTVSSSRA